MKISRRRAHEWHSTVRVGENVVKMKKKRLVRRCFFVRSFQSVPYFIFPFRFGKLLHSLCRERHDALFFPCESISQYIGGSPSSPIPVEHNQSRLFFYFMARISRQIPGTADEHSPSFRLRTLRGELRAPIIFTTAHTSCRGNEM